MEKVNNELKEVIQNLYKDAPLAEKELDEGIEYLVGFLKLPIEADIEQKKKQIESK